MYTCMHVHIFTCACMCVHGCTSICVCMSVMYLCLHWFGTLRAQLSPGKASGSTPRGHLPLLPDYSLWPASPTAVLSLRVVLTSPAAPPTPCLCLWSEPGSLGDLEGRCPEKHQALTCDVAEPQVAERQNHPGGLGLSRGQAHLLGQVAFARMPNKPNALGHRDLHVHLQKVACAHGAWNLRPPSISHHREPTTSLSAPSKSHALHGRPPFQFQSEPIFIIVLLGVLSFPQPLKCHRSSYPLGPRPVQGQLFHVPTGAWAGRDHSTSRPPRTLPLTLSPTTEPTASS